jgi:tRNA uridine 5-carbamoylmethylation protein Kti12
LPASGKTTIATHLAKDLGLQYVGKDQYKIEMYEKYGFFSVEEKKNLNKKAEEIMYSRLYSLLQNGYNVVFDKFNYQNR